MRLDGALAPKVIILILLIWIPLIFVVCIFFIIILKGGGSDRVTILLINIEVYFVDWLNVTLIVTIGSIIIVREA